MKKNGIWRINVKTDGFFSLGPVDLFYFQENFIGKTMVDKWSGPPAYETFTKKGKLQDFVAWYQSAPLISERLYNLLIDRPNTGCEFLPFGMLKGNFYFVVNVISIFNTIDFAKSDINFFGSAPNGMPRSISIFENDIKYTDIFNLKGIDRYLYISDDFADFLFSNNVSGFDLSLPETDVFDRVIRGQSLDDYTPRKTTKIT